MFVKLYTNAGLHTLVKHFVHRFDQYTSLLLYPLSDCVACGRMALRILVTLDFTLVSSPTNAVKAKKYPQLKKRETRIRWGVKDEMVTPQDPTVEEVEVIETKLLLQSRIRLVP